ncbi:MAG: chaperone modulator CbpM [Nitrospirales bacterium]|nr:hypothetical protein [Nitrospira sp.]MDR4502535.1 chaperone modulator CbpM [Nitrospirales bacterium]
MPDELNPDIDQVIAELFQPESYRREELCTCLGIGHELLDVCLSWELIQVTHTNMQGEEFFSTDAAERLSSALRLHRDLGINWAGVAVALELLDRISELEHTVHTQTKDS